MTGFKDNSRLSIQLHSQQQKNANRAHVWPSKGRFRKLNVMVDLNLVEDVPFIVLKACVLHSFCLSNEDDDEFLDPHQQ